MNKYDAQGKPIKQKNPDGCQVCVVMFHNGTERKFEAAEDDEILVNHSPGGVLLIVVNGNKEEIFPMVTIKEVHKYREKEST